MMKKPKVSIITIAYKNPAGLESTIKSVLGQTYENIEYIVIDGESGKETLDVIAKYQSDIDHWVSEPDKGIYDAMNKGIQAASGQWLNFMNSGDIFCSKDAVKEVFQNTSYAEKSLVYGYKYEGGKAVYPMSVKYLEKGIIMACHQAMFFNRDLIGDELYYDLAYPIYADYELVNRIKMKFPNSFEEVPVAIAISEGGGVSSRPTSQKRSDKYLILYKHYGALKVISAVMFRLRQGFGRSNSVTSGRVKG